MNRYSELKEKLALNHSVCQSIESELKTIQPPEMWICFYKDKQYEPEAFDNEKEAMEYRTCMIEKVVRYVLPQPESGKAPIPE